MSRKAVPEKIQFPAYDTSISKYSKSQVSADEVKLSFSLPMQEDGKLEKENLTVIFKENKYLKVSINKIDKPEEVLVDINFRAEVDIKGWDLEQADPYGQFLVLTFTRKPSKLPWRDLFQIPVVINEVDGEFKVEDSPAPFQDEMNADVKTFIAGCVADFEKAKANWIANNGEKIQGYKKAYEEEKEKEKAEFEKAQSQVEEETKEESSEEPSEPVKEKKEQMKKTQRLFLKQSFERTLEQESQMLFLEGVTEFHGTRSQEDKAKAFEKLKKAADFGNLKAIEQVVGLVSTQDLVSSEAIDFNIEAALQYLYRVAYDYEIYGDEPSKRMAINRFINRFLSPTSPMIRFEQVQNVNHAKMFSVALATKSGNAEHFFNLGIFLDRINEQNSKEQDLALEFFKMGLNRGLASSASNVGVVMRRRSNQNPSFELLGMKYDRLASDWDPTETSPEEILRRERAQEVIKMQKRFATQSPTSKDKDLDEAFDEMMDNQRTEALSPTAKKEDSFSSILGSFDEDDKKADTKSSSTPSSNSSEQSNSTAVATVPKTKVVSKPVKKKPKKKKKVVKEPPTYLSWAFTLGWTGVMGLGLYFLRKKIVVQNQPKPQYQQAVPQLF